MPHATRSARRKNASRRKQAATSQKPLPKEEQEKRAEANAKFNRGLHKWAGYSTVTYKDR